MIGITSYLPDKDSRVKRLEAHRQQLEWLKFAFPEEDIVVCYQNYKPEEIPIESDLVFDEGIGAAPARNEVLKKFYSSDDDVLMLLDDDVWFYDYYNAKDFLKDIRNVKSWGMITPLNPAQSPFKEMNFKNIEIIEHSWILERCTSVLACGCYILRNFKKVYNKEYYFNTEMHPWELTGYEDIDFTLQLLADNIPVYKCCQVVEKGPNNESTLFDTEQYRLANHKQNISISCNKWLHIGVTSDGKVKNIKQSAQKILLVPRSTPYVLESNLYPKPKNTGMKSIF